MSDNVPDHGSEHDALLIMCNKALNIDGSKIGEVILITIGKDGRPMIGTSLPGPDAVNAVLEQVISFRADVANIREVITPKDN